MMRCGLAIFVKTPGYSPIKTRLAASRGRSFAEAFHRYATQAVAEVAQLAARNADENGFVLVPHWAVAEDAAMDDPIWSGLPRLVQGNGSLGLRMAQVHSQLLHRYDAAMLIGADTPQLLPSLLIDATTALIVAGQRPHAVLGPAADGGFWLFASNRAAPESAWTSVPYSCADTAERFRAALGCFDQWTALPALVDVDRDEDLAALQPALRQLASPTPHQSALLDWLDSHL